MKTIYCFVFCMLALTCGTRGQYSCLFEGITFTRQGQIDSFQINYPGCTRVQGSISIMGNDIYNLEGLNVVTFVGGELWIFNNENLNDFNGLNALNYIGSDLSILQNDNLTSLNGLNNLISVGGDLEILNNDILSTLMGLNVLNYVGGDLSLSQNNSLTNMNGLSSLQSVGGSIEVSNNNALKTLTGLNGLRTINNSLNIRWNPLLNDLTGLSALKTVGGTLEINGNNSMVSLSGISILQSIGGSLLIKQNPVLTVLTALKTLKSIGYNLIITDNALLPSLNGIDNINSASISGLFIYNNFSLTECEVNSICEYLLNPNGIIDIHDNDVGCNSQSEIAEACAVVSIDPFTPERIFSVFPNPGSGIITIINEKKAQSNHFSLMNINGQRIMDQDLRDDRLVIDVSVLPEGVYFIRITGRNTVQIEKFIKQ
ncbi:MAG TPA: T9SS type A sorting domain-containing protein [Bacteroidales bacterium]|nr:T9SS type A sorting domain-containing protein [Bacteroidales bacterium]HPS51513.1 T9SS type A sorting domain-containing protein [Bacteroidales bacterium]